MSGRGWLTWCVLVLVGCGSETPGAPVAREGRLTGEPPSVLIMLAEAALPSGLDRQGALIEGPLVARGTRLAAAYARYDSASAARADLLGADGALPGVRGGGDLRERFVAAGYATPQLSASDLAPLWEGAAPAFAVLDLGAEEPLHEAASIVAAIDASGHGAEVLWVVTALQGDPGAPAISEARLAVPLVMGLSGRLDVAELRPQVVTHADLGVTIHDLCGLGLSPGEGAQGDSFARILIKQPHAWRGHVLARRVEPVEDEPIGWVRSLKWRLVVGGAPGDRLTWIHDDPQSSADDRGRPGAAAAQAEMERVFRDWTSAAK